MEEQEYTGTPSSDEAPDESLSPSLDEDTQDDLGSDYQDAGTDDRLAAVLADMENLKKRVANQTRSWQEERKRAAQYEAELQRIRQRDEKLIAAGINPNDLLGMIMPGEPGYEQQQQAQQATPATPQTAINAAVKSQDILTRDQLEARLLMDKWEDKKAEYFRNHPEIDTPEFRRFFDAAAAEKVRKEMEEYGRIDSTVYDFVDHADKTVMKILSTLEKKVRKASAETREKINSQQVADSKQTKATPKEEPEADLTNEDYISRFNEHLDRVRRRR
jgi:molybdopterin-biosynthesis enzyme MoeA-like protein